MVRVVAAALFLNVLLITAAAGVESNEEFCAGTLREVADSLIADLQPPQQAGVVLLPTAGFRGELLYDRLVESLQNRGYEVYLSDSSSSQRPSLQTSLDGLQLDYHGLHSGFFSRGQVERSCLVSAGARLLDSQGKLLNSASIVSYGMSDTLDFESARLARSGDGLYSPDMPASLYQRLVEPTLILSITGALVYLFFASR
jgi:hypothetical protein